MPTKQETLKLPFSMLNPKRRNFLMAAVGFGSAFLSANQRFDVLASSEDDQQSVVRTSFALGTKVSITVLHHDRGLAERALDAAFAAIEQVEANLSIYRPSSQLSRLNSYRRITQPHADLRSVLEFSREVSLRSHGAFDITVQPLWDLFASASKLGRLPSTEQIDLAKQHVDWRRVQLNPNDVRLLDEGTRVTLNGIAQGYAADRAMIALKEKGVRSALIDTGELAALGTKSHASGWRIGMQHPREKDAFISLADLKDRCLSTSGDYATSFSDDRRYHHIFDPATGISPSEFASVSVAAPTAMQADAWSTAAMVMGPTKALEAMRSLPNHDAFFVLKDGRTLSTLGFPHVNVGAAS